jgi:homoserine dehydrogenase
VRALDPQTLRDARRVGTPLKLVTTLERTREGSVEAVVRPEPLAASDPLSIAEGTTLMVHFKLDVLPGLSLIAHGPNLQSTAYGMLADFINAEVRG